MFTTIIFFFALFISIAYALVFIRTITRDDEFGVIDIIAACVPCLVWSLFYYLSH